MANAQTALSFSTDGGIAPQPPIAPTQRRLDIYGDSITAGNQIDPKTCQPDWAGTYGRILCDAFDANCNFLTLVDILGIPAAFARQVQQPRSFGHPVHHHGSHVGGVPPAMETMAAPPDLGLQARALPSPARASLPTAVTPTSRWACSGSGSFPATPLPR